MYPLPEYDCDFPMNNYPTMVVPMVYAWKRGNQFLYIGMTYNGTYRLKNHNIIGVVEKIKANDLLIIWRDKDNQKLCLLEIELIKRYHPQYNLEHSNTVKQTPVWNEDGRQICCHCLKVLKRPRSNKLFCNSKCRNRYWNQLRPTPFTSKYHVKGLDD